MNDAPAPIGDNRPPPDLLVGEALRERLREETAELIKRREYLREFVDKVPAVIENDDVCGRLNDFLKSITAMTKAAEGTRVAAKEPYLEGGRTVDGFFKKEFLDIGANWYGKLKPRLDAYLREKAARERREREEKERLAREEADRLRREAAEREQAARDEATLKAAVEAEARAKAAEADAIRAGQDARAKPADLSRTRGELGGVSSLVPQWAFDELDRETLDLEALRAHIPRDGLEKAVRSFIKAGGRELRGVKIFKIETARVV